jgi:hypothetical protein
MDKGESAGKSVHGWKKYFWRLPGRRGSDETAVEQRFLAD